MEEVGQGLQLTVEEIALREEDPEIKKNQPPWRRWLALAAIAGIVLLRLLIPPTDGQASSQLHMLLEFAAAIIAILSGVLALMRYFTGRNTTFLYLGIGFFGVGIIDGYHAILSGIWFNQLLTNISLQNWFWLWNTSGFFLAVLIVGSWWLERGGREISSRGRWWFLGVGVALLAFFLFLTILPLSPTIENEMVINQVLGLITAVLFLIASAGYFVKNYWQGDGFEFSLLLAMVILAAANGLFLVFTQEPFDSYSTIAVWLKLLAYVIVLGGLINSIYFLFSRAEGLVAEQTRVNAALQREFAERERAEAAEQEQRKLAEALREVSIAFSSTLNIAQLLDLLLERILDVLPFDTANVMLVQGDEVEIVSTRGYGPHKVLQQPGRFLMSSIPSLQRMMESGRPLIIPNTLDHELWVNADSSPHVRSWAGAPIIVKDEIVAFLALNYSEPNVYQPEQAARLSAFAAHAAVAFENANLYEELQKRVSELTTLNNISQAITSTLELEENLTIITHNITELLEVDATSVILHDPEKADLYFAAASGEASDFVLGNGWLWVRELSVGLRSMVKGYWCRTRRQMIDTFLILTRRAVFRRNRSCVFL
jgi:GAF domain-containing protein